MIPKCKPTSGMWGGRERRGLSSPVSAMGTARVCGKLTAQPKQHELHGRGGVGGYGIFLGDFFFHFRERGLCYKLDHFEARSFALSRSLL